MDPAHGVKVNRPHFSKLMITTELVCILLWSLVVERHDHKYEDDLVHTSVAIVHCEESSALNHALLRYQSPKKSL